MSEPHAYWLHAQNGIPLLKLQRISARVALTKSRHAESCEVLHARHFQKLKLNSLQADKVCEVGARQHSTTCAHAALPLW